MKHILLVGLLLIISASAGYGQKVKYKDLFVLLKAENFDQAEPFLRRFLSMNPEHPNANYQMGKMLQQQMQQADLLDPNNRVGELADSAIMYFDKAYSLCTEKYVERQHDDDYYAEFKRRDLRTGKFIVKLSDVQLDIEQRKKAVQTYKENNELLAKYFNETKRYYPLLVNLYKSLVEDAQTLTKLYFTADAEDLQVLRRIATVYDSCLFNYNSYRSALKEMGKEEIVPELEVKPIDTYPLDVTPELNFTDKLVLFNFKDWSKTVLDKITREVYPLKERMVKYDEELADTHKRIVTDSIDGRPEVFGLATKNVGRDIEDYDTESLPAALFDYRIAEINYHSTTNFWYKEVADTADVELKLDVLTDIEKQLNSMTKLLVRLEKVNVQEERELFRDFIATRYQGDAGLDRFLEEQKQFVEKDSLLLQAWIDEVRRMDQKTIWHQDTIPLVVGGEAINLDSIRISTVWVDSLESRRLGFYTLFEKDDSLTFSFGVAPSSRILDTLYQLPINKFIIENGRENFALLTDSLGADKRVWVLNSVPRDSTETINLQVFTSSLSNGPGWNKELTISQAPAKLQVDRVNGAIMLLNEKEEEIARFDESGNLIEEQKD